MIKAQSSTKSLPPSNQSMGAPFRAVVSEERVPEKGQGAEIDGEVEGFPCAAAELYAEVGSDDRKRDDVESDGADSVFREVVAGSARGRGDSRTRNFGDLFRSSVSGCRRTRTPAR